MKHFWYYFLLTSIGLSLLAINLLGFVVSLLIGKKRCSGLMRPLVLADIRCFRHLIHICQVGNFTLDGIAAPVGSSPRLYVANHSGLLDAVILLDALPNITCVFKAGLRKSIFLSQIPAAIGFLANDDSYGLIRSMVQELESGKNVLIFPEGTRTDTQPINAFKTGFAVIATKAQTPVQTILIDNPTHYSGKGRSLLRPPKQMPFRYHFKLGAEIVPQPGESVRDFSARVENYFRETLPKLDQAHAALS